VRDVVDVLRPFARSSSAAFGRSEVVPQLPLV